MEEPTIPVERSKAELCEDIAELGGQLTVAMSEALEKFRTKAIMETETSM
jgi:hypothetical protein